MHIVLLITILIVLLIFIFVFGFVIGISTTLSEEKNSVGTLHIETSDPDGAYIFLEMKGPIENLLDKDFVTLKIDTDNYISQQ